MATLSFWGGVGTVTGSRYLVEAKRARILVDCGLFQGLKELRDRNWQAPPFEPASLEAVVITHAHIDHTGYLPRLVRDGFHGPIYCSRATADLLRLLLPDSARLQEEEADYRNRHGLTKHQPALPLYTEEDAQKALRHLRPVADREADVEVAPGMRARFINAGHILGSRYVLLTVETGHGEERTVLFSGDLGQYEQPILRDPVPPPACDYLLVESTYGDRLHDPEDPKEALCRAINEAAPRKSTILIPAFAIGRTQELIYAIRELEDEERIPILPVRVDSPMALAATRAYEQHREEQDADYAHLFGDGKRPLSTRSMRMASSKEESKRVNDERGARIVISAAGMMTGGRVLHHALRALPDPDATLLFVGYQAEGTTGRRILNGEHEVKIMREWVPVRCHVQRIEGFSAHADWKGVMRWLEGMPGAPRRVFAVHGETGAADAMRDRIVERFGWPVDVPQYGDRVDL